MATSALASRAPSMIEAWLSSSDTMRTPGPPRTVRTPRLAANPVGNTRAASVCFQSANSACSSSCTGRVPQISREAPAPVPQRWVAADAASITAGWELRPR